MINHTEATNYLPGKSRLSQNIFPHAEKQLDRRIEFIGNRILHKKDRSEKPDLLGVSANL
jgi:hypothetical protein